MCTSKGTDIGTHDDRVFATHVVAQVKARDLVKLHLGVADESELISKMIGARLIVSMRFHGNVYSTILGKPWIGIVSHDKMISYFKELGINNYQDYYGFTKKRFKDVLKNHLPQSDYLAVADRERRKWAHLKGVVLERFGV